MDVDQPALDLQRGGRIGLLEHKSTVDADAPYQLLRYKLDVLLADRQCGERRGRAAGVIAIVFYHGRRRWNVPHVLAPSAGADAWPRFHGPMEYYLVDLSRERDRFTGDGELHAAISAMTMARRPVSTDDLLDNVTGGLVPGSDREMLTFDCMIETTKVTEEQLRASLMRTRPEKGEEDMTTTLREMKPKAQREARREGQASLLLRPLKHRFREAPEHAVDRIRGATATELETLAEAVLSASSVNDMLETVPRH